MARSHKATSTSHPLAKHSDRPPSRRSRLGDRRRPGRLARWMIRRREGRRRRAWLVLGDVARRRCSPADSEGAYLGCVRIGPAQAGLTWLHTAGMAPDLTCEYDEGCGKPAAY